MSNGAQMLQTLRDHRPLLLACEAIGWLHMTCKAHPDFLRRHGGAGVDYHDRNWLNSVSWDAKLSWLLDQRTRWHKLLSSHWPGTLSDFIRKHRNGGAGILGLLQAAHGMASGIEKNVPSETSRYLNQDATHMWLVSPFGYPTRNLLADPPPLLQPDGWRELLERIEKLLDQLAGLGSSPPPDSEPWWEWREYAIGRDGWLRQAFLSTLAETRLPNNDVTLWDQSYVAAALFKSAVAGAVLTGQGFEWANNLRQQTRWRVLTVGLGTRHYEARSVKIGDWVGAQRDIEKFFEEVRKLIEVDMALGSLVYRDDETLAFTFPGQREDNEGSLGDNEARNLREAIEKEIENLARDAQLETPPLCRLSTSTRSFVPMVAELRKVRNQLVVPIHRQWTIQSGVTMKSTGARHVCPVCLVRFNESAASANTDDARKSYPCRVCRQRRRGRLDAWLDGEGDTIWISEVADANDRVALLSLSFDLEPWLDGERVDSLRAQAYSQWRLHNPKVNRSIENQCRPSARSHPQSVLEEYFAKRISKPPQQVHTDGVLRAVLPGLVEEFSSQKAAGAFHRQSGRITFQRIFRRLVEDRASGVAWSDEDSHEDAKWFVFQSFRKLPSPGRVHRFWRTCEEFFDGLLERFREVASGHQNRWRTRRLLLQPTSSNWENRETYLGRWRGSPFEVVYLADRQAFITISNLARCFEAQEGGDALVQASQQEAIYVKGDDQHELDLQVRSVSTPDKVGTYTPVIPLDRSPQRFRVLVPLDRATACIEAAIAKWQEEFARVWDRMPLRIGVVAFPRLTPFHAVIEAVRNVEAALDRQSSETWRVLACRTWKRVTALSLEHERGQELILVPTRLPDCRQDVFYAYVQVEDQELRWPLDFKHPKGTVYRHITDLRPGDGAVLCPSRIAAVFLDTTARRFEPHDVKPLRDFERMRATWELLVRHAPSLTRLRGTWSELEERSRAWRDPEGRWLPCADKEWLDLVRAILRDRLKVHGAALETLVEAAGRGTLEWALEWHLTWLKEGLEGAET